MSLIKLAVFTLLTLFVVLPLAGVVALVGLPIVAVLGVVAVPVVLLLLAVGLPIFILFVIAMAIMGVVFGLLGAVVGLGLLCGIGFTMSLFIASLAFEATPALARASVLGVLGASLVAATAGYVWLRFVLPEPRPASAA